MRNPTVPGDVGDQISALLEQIRLRYPELRLGKVSLNEEGQYNTVLIVNETLVFRFAKVPGAVSTLRTEVAVQRCLHDRLPLPIPNPTYHNLDTEVIGRAFAGYRMIPGKPLWRPAFSSIGNVQALDRMASQLAGFLHSLHTTPAETVPIELPRHETHDHWTVMYDRIRGELLPFMRSEARKHVTAHFESFLHREPEWRRTEPSLRHGDFGTGNILYDPERLSIAGIIDFGHVGLGDPACDFAGLLSSYGAEFYARCAAAYPEMVAAMARVRFIQGTFALEEALFGLDNGDRAAYEAGMAQYV
jgi:aminoglycoside 2''-phosphotransferase